MYLYGSCNFCGACWNPCFAFTIIPTIRQNTAPIFYADLNFSVNLAHSDCWSQTLTVSCYGPQCVELRKNQIKITGSHGSIAIRAAPLAVPRGSIATTVRIMIGRCSTSHAEIRSPSMSLRSWRFWSAYFGGSRTWSRICARSQSKFLFTPCS